MFGEMNVIPIADLRHTPEEVGGSVDGAVARLLDVTEHPRIAKWVQFPKALFVFLIVPGDPESGAFYVYDRRARVWFWLDFDDEKFGGYTVSDFDRLVRECRFLDIVEHPQLLQAKNTGSSSRAFGRSEAASCGSRDEEPRLSKTAFPLPHFIHGNSNRSKDLAPTPTYLTKAKCGFR